MNKYNIAGILRTYAEQCIKTETDQQLKKVLCRLREDLGKAEKEVTDGQS